MRCIFLSILCLLCSLPAMAWTGTVVTVHDGDTLQVQHPDGSIVKVRVYGIDCPELDQPWGQQARAMTEEITLGKTVEVIPAQSHKSYHREVAGIVLPGQMMVLQDFLVSAGLAWVDGRYCKLAVCDLWRQHQTDAAAASPPRGLWADPASLPPWQWRKIKKIQPQ